MAANGLPPESLRLTQPVLYLYVGRTAAGTQVYDIPSITPSTPVECS